MKTFIGINCRKCSKPSVPVGVSNFCVITHPRPDIVSVVKVQVQPSDGHKKVVNPKA